MIRINLLPQAKKVAGRAAPAASADSGSNQVWAIVYLVAVAIWMVVLGAVFFNFQGQLDDQRAKNGALEQQIQRLRAESANLEEVKGKLDKSRQLEEVVNRLMNARLGPTRVMMELIHVLSAGGGPTIDPQRLERLRRDNPLAGFNPGWDARRLWITNFEEENRECRIAGRGRTNEDVAEFLRRLALSELFENVTLERTSSIEDAEAGMALIDFELVCKVRY